MEETKTWIEDDAGAVDTANVQDDGPPEAAPSQGDEADDAPPVNEDVRNDPVRDD